jgi:septal ring factor EnvC (AmiA/AmiB activator)
MKTFQSEKQKLSELNEKLAESEKQLKAVKSQLIDIAVEDLTKAEKNILGIVNKII